jgi:hypothetical protein
VFDYIWTFESRNLKSYKDDWRLEDPFDVDFDESPVIPLSREENPRRQDTSHEDEVEADKYFPVDIMAESSVRVIYPLVAQPTDLIIIQAVPNLMAQER